jgi:hypothetical protein
LSYPSRQRDHRIRRLCRDLVRLADVWRDEQSVELRPITEIVQRSVNAVFACRALAESQSLVVSLVHQAGSIEGSEKTILTGAKSWMNSGEAAFGAYVSDIVIDDVLEGFDVRVCQLGEIGGDIVVELKRGR